MIRQDEPPDGPSIDPADMAAQAAAWVVRLANDPADEADGLNFLAWLDGEPVESREARRAAFDRAQAVWLSFDDLAQIQPGFAQSDFAQPDFALQDAAVRRDRRPGRVSARRTDRRTGRRPGVIAALAAVAACVAVLGWAALRPQLSTGPAPGSQTYATAPGERRTVILADGSRIEMDGATRLDVAVGGRDRRVSLERGEANFDVVHDPTRSFVVALGPADVRVLGTAFDIVRDDGRTEVDVSRGVVSLSSAGRSLRVPAGQGAELAQGGVIQQHAAVVDDIGAWREGRRLYWDRPLSQVVADLNRRYPQPIRLADVQTGRIHFTGVLVLGSRPQMVRRLTTLLPLDARAGEGGEIVLSSRRP